MNSPLDEFDGTLPTLENLDGTPIETPAPQQETVSETAEVKEPTFRDDHVNAEQKYFGDMPSPYTLPEELRRKKPEAEEYDPYSYTAPKSDFYSSDSTDFSTLAEQGRNIVKVIAIIVIVISAFDAVAAIATGSFASIGGAVIRIIAAVEFMQGKNGGRIFLILCSIVTVIASIAYIFVIDWAILQLLYVFLAIGFAVIGYLLCFDKRVKAYFGK